MTTTHTTTIGSPLGDIVLVGNPNALTGLWFADEHRHTPDVDPGWIEDRSVFTEAIAQLDEYFAGTRIEFELRLDTDGTTFQEEVWSTLRTVPYGTTITYAELATKAGRPRAARAAGAANGRNPISIVIPCHRVIGSTGHLTDYGGGLHRKQALLDLEARTELLGTDR